MSQGSVEDTRRDKFLVQMYSEVWGNINRHLSTVWQSAGVLASAFAIFALVEKETLPIDFASSLVVLIAAWLIALTYDANAWYNRNLIIAANIERQFLIEKDSREIHHFFTRHRTGENMVDHLKIHFYFGAGLAAIVLISHFITRVVPGFGASFCELEMVRSIPYVTALGSGWWIWWFRNDLIRKHDDFVRKSPGRDLT